MRGSAFGRYLGAADELVETWKIRSTFEASHTVCAFLPQLSHHFDGGIPNRIEGILVEVCFRYLARIFRHRSLLSSDKQKKLISPTRMLATWVLVRLGDDVALQSAPVCPSGIERACAVLVLTAQNHNIIVRHGEDVSSNLEGNIIRDQGVTPCAALLTSRAGNWWQ